MKDIKLTLVHQSDIDQLYIDLCISDSIAKIVNKNSGMLMLANKLAEGLHLMALKIPPEEFSEDIFKLEICIGMNRCLENETLTSIYGFGWFARDKNILEIIDLIYDSVKE